MAEKVRIFDYFFAYICIANRKFIKSVIADKKIVTSL